MLCQAAEHFAADSWVFKLFVGYVSVTTVDIGSVHCQVRGLLYSVFAAPAHESAWGQVGVV